MFWFWKYSEIHCFQFLNRARIHYFSKFKFQLGFYVLTSKSSFNSLYLHYWKLMVYSVCILWRFTQFSEYKCPCRYYIHATRKCTCPGAWRVHLHWLVCARTFTSGIVYTYACVHLCAVYVCLMRMYTKNIIHTCVPGDHVERDSHMHICPCLCAREVNVEAQLVHVRLYTYTCMWIWYGANSSMCRFVRACVRVACARENSF